MKLIRNVPISFIKLVKGFLGVLIILIVTLVGVALMRKDIAHLYISHKYQEQLVYLEKHLHVLVTEDEEKVRDIFAPDAPWLDNGLIVKLKSGLEGIDTSEFKARYFSDSVGDSTDVVAFVIYFHDDESLYMDVLLKKEPEWRIKSLMLSPAIIKSMEAKGIL